MAKILLVEDNTANADMLSRRLRRSGHHVVLAADGEEAVSMASSEAPDIILMDLHLPVLDGWAATRRIKETPSTSGIPVIALTAHAMREDRERATNAGCDDYDTKPVNLPRLLEKIAAQLPGGAGSGTPNGAGRMAPNSAAAEHWDKLPGVVAEGAASRASGPAAEPERRSFAPVSAAPAVVALQAIAGVMDVDGASSVAGPSTVTGVPTVADAATTTGAARGASVADATGAVGLAEAVGKGRLLIVDDTPANRDMLARRLGRSGYAAETAADGPTALERIRAVAFDLILLDVMMPGVSGIEVLDELRRTHAASDLPVIMATARDASADIVEAFEHGANDYVTKPLDFPVVLARVQTQLALKRAIDETRRLERDLAERNRALQTANLRMKADLDAAVKVQAALLPSSSPQVDGYTFAWRFEPSAELAGDIFNVFRLDDRYVGVYVLDVSGHGVAAALLSVTVSRFLFPIPDPTSLLWERTVGGELCRLASPARVAERLSQRFPFDTTTGQYFTLVYGLLDLHEHRFRYVSAGHPQIVHRARGGEPVLVEASGYPVGVGPPEYEEFAVDLAPGDRIYIYSDGIPETMSSDGELFGCTRLLDTLRPEGDGTAEQSLKSLLAHLRHWSGLERGQDDQTILCVERA